MSQSVFTTNKNVRPIGSELSEIDISEKIVIRWKILSGISIYIFIDQNNESIGPPIKIGNLS